MGWVVLSSLFAALAGGLLFAPCVEGVRIRRRSRRMRELALPQGLADSLEGEPRSVDRGFGNGGFFSSLAVALPRFLFGAKGERRAATRLEVQKHLPEMIDAVALGMKAGLSFESAFALYSSRFDDSLAQACHRACSSWESGLVSRNDALIFLAQELDDPVMTRFVGNVVRCLRFGSSMTRVFDVMAEEARSCYRMRMEEMVAKVPVKMLIPTAGLILPAMLIVIMGPVMLEFL